MRRKPLRYKPGPSDRTKRPKGGARKLVVKGAKLKSVVQDGDGAHGTRKQSKKKRNAEKRSQPRVEDNSYNEDTDDATNAEVDHVVSAAQGSNANADEEGQFPFSQCYFRAREGNPFGRKPGKKVSDIDLVEEQELRAALLKVTPKHEEERAALLDSYKIFYPKWHFQLTCGFGLIMYGFGSKKTLLEEFASSTLTDGAAVVVNGYLSTINMKPVVFTIADALWGQKKSCRKTSSKSCKSTGDRPLITHSLDELSTFLNEEEEHCHVYVIIHNIDGPGLRDADAQQVLANIAACSQVRIIASVDHVNAPLLWDKRMASTKFNWWWHHTPTFAPYTLEALHLPLLLASSGVAKSARSAMLVLQSLTPNAQSVFRTLADYQLSHSEEQGLPVHRLYTLCRERFLVSSELTLRAHLTEFKDHELVRSRRGLDGQDCLYIPLPPDALTKLLEDVND